MANSLNPVSFDLIYFTRELAAQLQNSLVLAPSIDVRTFPAGSGSHLRVPVLAPLAAAATRSIGGSITPVAASATQISVDVQQITNSIALDALEQTYSNVDLETNYAARLGYTIAAQVDTTIANLINYVPNEVGTLDGTAAFGSTPLLSKIALAKAQLRRGQCPMTDLSMVVTSTEEGNLLQTPNLYKVNEAGSPALLRTGYLGSVYNFDLYASQQIANATLNTATDWGTPVVVGVNPIGTTSLAVSGLAASAAMVAGSTFALGGTNYVITAPVTASTGAATLSIFPGLRAATTVSQVITPVSHSAKGSMNLAFQRDSIVGAFVAPMSMAGAGCDEAYITDDQTGISVRVIKENRAVNPGGSASYQTYITADVIFGASVVVPEWIVKVTGAV